MSRDVPPLLGLRIGREKIVDYLLDPTHPKGGSKAVFLMRFGFTAALPDLLSDALAQHFLEAPHARMTTDSLGAVRIVCEGVVRGLDGREPTIRSVWMVEPDRHARLLTIVPRPPRRA